MDHKKLIWTTVLFVIFTQYCLAETTTRCSLNSTGGCIFKNIKTTVDQPLFYPTAENPLEVNALKFVDSSIEVLTNEICRAFPNLDSLTATSVDLKRIDDVALKQCSKLTFVSFFNNFLESIPTDFFKYNPHLTSFIFQKNLLKKFEPTILIDLPKLTGFSLSENYINDLSFDEFPYLYKLEKLYLYRNELNDLNVFKMAKKFPNLKEIYLDDNPFDCGKLGIILTALKQLNITIKFLGAKKRTRRYVLSLIENVDCYLQILEDVEEKNKVEEFNWWKYIKISSVGLTIVGLTILIIYAVLIKKNIGFLSHLIENSIDSQNGYCFLPMKAT